MADPQYISLSTKPTAQISYTFHPPTSTSSTKNPLLVVFLNGLALPQTSWFPAITKLQEHHESTGSSLPALLTYDRFGQGTTTDRDPNDLRAEDPAHGHDCLDVVRDLRQLLTQLVPIKLQTSIENTPLILVANSIGGALACLYAQEYPGTVSGVLFLDSVLANSDFVSIFPDPAAQDFNPSSLPSGVDIKDLRRAREITRRIFHPSNPSREGLSRRNLPSLLPHSDGPVLSGPGGKGPFVTVVGHDFEAFAAESEGMGMPRALTMEYTNPFWEAYNRGLVRITDTERARGPVRAGGAGHFVQRDRPDVVVEELVGILKRVYRESS